MSRVLVAAVLLAMSFDASASSSASAAHLSIALHSETKKPRPGGAVSLGIEIRPQPGWHIYWKNPGESGLPPTLHWTLPTGVTAGAPRYPVPSAMTLNGIAANVYREATTLLVDLSVAATVPRGTRLPVGLDAEVLTCTEGHCVPQSVAVNLTMTAGDGQPDPAEAGRFRAARAALPRPIGTALAYRLEKGMLHLQLPDGLLSDTSSAHVFFDDDHHTAGAPQRLDETGGRHTIVMPWRDPPPTGSLRGVIRVDPPAGDEAAAKGYRFSAKPEAVPAPAPTALQGGFWLTLGAAVLGGLLLNLMPCVFPILSIKAVALARAGGSASAARIESVCYTAGTVLTLAALGAAVLVLRHAGSTAGWAFQLQDARVVAGLLVLVTAIAGNLAGLFELPSLSFGAGQSDGMAASFGAGALAAFVATPCTGPFMAGALGAALVLPSPQALGVFAGLGFGLALPFLALGFVPPLRRWLPRPGPWMATLRRTLSLPMFATALGLAWIVGREAGVAAMTYALGAALLTGIALWWYGLRQASGRSAAIAMVPVLAAVASVAVGLPGRSSTAAPGALSTRPYSASLLAELRAEHHPVFLYLTADWCMTCKVNEATSLSAPSVARAFSRADVTVLEGDWTRGDPRITKFLTEHGRAGVPLYVWYPADGAPRDLPQILTPSMLIALTR